MNYLCLSEIEAFRHKLNHGSESMKRCWEHMLWIARQDDLEGWYAPEMQVASEGLVRPMVRPDERSYAFLAYAVTGEAVYATAARRRIMQVAESVDERVQGEWVQMHTWCDAFPMGRWMVLYDWVADSEVFSETDHAYIHKQFMDYLYHHVYACLLGRHLDGTPGNNQNASMAFACLAGGIVFGRKRGQDPRCRELIALGAKHLVTFLTGSPRGGYSFEGSAYMGGVNSLLIPLATELVRSIDGQDLWESRLDDDCASVHETLKATMRLWMPGNLMLPWDNYGFQRAEFMPAAAYYAARTEDGEIFSQLLKAGVWNRSTHQGWGFEQNLWIMLFWPAEVTRSEQAWYYAEPSIGAGATGPAGRLFSYMYWDRCHWLPLRAHFNPNHLGLSYDGRPLLLDGRCVTDAKESTYDAPAYQAMRMDMLQSTNIGQGTIGSHNCLVLNGNDAYATHASTEGELIALDVQDEASVFISDATSCYREGYDVARITRGTLILGDEYVLVKDVILAPNELSIGWRAHLRWGKLAVSPGCLELCTEDENWLAICHEGEASHRAFPPAEATPLPHQISDGCLEITIDHRGSDLVIYTLLVAESATQVLDELDTWTAQLCSDLTAAEELDPTSSGTSIESLDSVFYPELGHEPGVIVYACTFNLDAIPKGHVWLEIGGMIRGVSALVNGHRLSFAIPPEYQDLLPTRIRVEQALQQGKNQLRLFVPTTLEGSLTGPVKLVASRPITMKPELHKLSDTEVQIQLGNRVDAVHWDNDTIRLDQANRTVILTPQPPVKPIDPPAQTSTDQAIEVLTRKLPNQISVRDHAAAAILGDDWKAAWDTLNEIRVHPSKQTTVAALELLRLELDHHPAGLPREPDDIVWYRLKAAAARALGAAKCTDAVPDLIRLLHSNDIYRSRVAAAQALGEIGTPEAVAALKAIPVHEEVNVYLMAQSFLGTN